MMSYVVVIIGFVFLLKGADFLVEGACGLARKLNVSELAIGLTVVAFGTSAPELFVNIFSGIQDTPQIAIGNILGSNICNILLILGMSALIYPLWISAVTVWKEIPFMFLAALAVGIMANDRWIDGANWSALTRTDGLVLLAFFAIFIYHTYNITKTAEETIESGPPRQWGIMKSSLATLSGLVGVVLGGYGVVKGAVELAVGWGVSETLVGLTIVAVGTSLPELATSAVAAYKKRTNLAVGNVVGSNIFNTLFILGASALIRPLPFQTGNNIDILVMIGASFLLFVWMFTGRKRRLDRWEGVLFLFLYAIYMGVIVLRG